MTYEVDQGWTTLAAVSTLSYYYFEHLVWKRFGGRIESGEFNIVHRLTPLSPSTPSIKVTLPRRKKPPVLAIRVTR